MWSEEPGMSRATPDSARTNWARTACWTVLALFLAAFAVFESVKYGLPTSVAALAFFALPALTRVVRVPGVLHQAVNRVWIPLAVLIGYSIGPVVWPPLFTAGLGWLTGIAVDRALGRSPVPVRGEPHPTAK
jgi:hypothetical protein